MGTYELVRTAAGVRLTDEAIVGRPRQAITPEASLKLRNHSPTGFEFGYLGSGPSQAALAILLHYHSARRRHRATEAALAAYQEFKAQFLGSAAGELLQITDEEITAFVNVHEHRRAREQAARHG